MRKYEVMCVFRAKDDEFNAGKDAVKQALLKLEAKIEKEEDMGERALAYQIQKNDRGHYFYFVVDMEPAKAFLIEKSVRLIEELLRVLVVNVDE